MQSNLLFQYCQKLVIISADKQSVLLARRQGEADYDGTFSFVGGKMETTDTSPLDGMRREKNEEIGKAAWVKVLPDVSYNWYFKKKDGNSVVLPHIAALFAGGDIVLNSQEYSEYRWVPIAELANFEPKIDNIPHITQWALGCLAAAGEADFSWL